MKLLESYAHQVVSYHPEKQRDELYAELYDALCEEFSDWQEQNPDGGEEAFLNERREHPMRYATRLAPEGSAYLIGPQFYYSFLTALKTGAVIVSIFYLSMAVISALASGAYLSSFLRMLFAIPVTLLWVSAAIFGVFIALEKSGERADWLDKWKARDLRKLESHQSISRSETFFDLGISTLALLWLLDIVHFPLLVRNDGQWINDWSVNLPDWFWVAAGVLLLFDIVYCIFRLTRNFWSVKLRVTTIVTNLLWMLLLASALGYSPLLSPAVDVASQASELVPLLNKVVRGVLWVICIVLAADTIGHVWRLIQPGKKSRDADKLPQG